MVRVGDHIRGEDVPRLPVRLGLDDEPENGGETRPSIDRGALLLGRRRVDYGDVGEPGGRSSAAIPQHVLHTLCGAHGMLRKQLQEVVRFHNRTIYGQNGSSRTIREALPQVSRRGLCAATVAGRQGTLQMKHNLIASRAT